MKTNGKVINSILIILTVISAAFLGFLIYTGLNNYINNDETTNLSIEPISKIENNVDNNESSQNVVGEYNIQQIEPVVPTIVTPNNSTVTNEIKYKYYYNQLDEYSKLIYEALEQNLENLKTGTYKIEFGNKFNVLLKQENGTQILNNKFQIAWDAFYYDRPDVFYLDPTKFLLRIETITKGFSTNYNVYLDNGENINYLQDAYTSKAQIDSIIKELENLKKQFKEQMLNISDKKEQIKALHDWIVDNVEYDVNMENINRYTICGALQDRKAVCEGYAKLFKYILDCVNIENVLVSGTAVNSKGQTEKHMWNYVNLEGIWYGVDCTWDDPIIQGSGSLTEELKYKYFLKGKEVFSIEHKTEPITENNTMLKYPEL